MEYQTKWKKVREIIDKARKEVVREVEGIKNHILEKHGKDLEKIAEELNIRYSMKIYEGDGDLFTITPVLYIKPLAKLDEKEKEELVEKVRKKMGEWGTQGRVRVIVVPELVEI
jgi:F420-0:gamma-glutamyl ligase-like protein